MLFRLARALRAQFAAAARTTDRRNEPSRCAAEPLEDRRLLTVNFVTPYDAVVEGNSSAFTADFTSDLRPTSATVSWGDGTSDDLATSMMDYDSTTGTGRLYGVHDFVYGGDWTVTFTVQVGAESDTEAYLASIADGTDCGCGGSASAASGNFAGGDALASDTTATTPTVTAAVVTRGEVNSLDLGQLKAKLNRTATNPGTGTAAYSVFADVNADGAINALDLGVVKAKLNTGLPEGEPATPAGAAPAGVDPAQLPQPVQVTQVFVNGQGITGQTTANGIAFRNLAGVDNTFGYPVQGSSQLKTIPWSNGINWISLRFTQDVASQLQQDDLVVRGINTANYAISGFTYNPAAKTGTWILSTTITKDKVRLFLDDALVSGLDGEWSNDCRAPDAYPSGNGTAGGDFDFRLNVLAGDVNQSAGLTCQPGVDLRIDADNTGVIDATIEEDNGPGKILAVNDGDADGDGVPDFADGMDLYDNSGADASAPFTPVELELLGNVDPSVAKFTITYNASNPAGITRSKSEGDVDYTYTPDSGTLRLWTKDGTQSRAVAQLGQTGGGDFIASGVSYRFADLPAGSQVNQTTWVFFLEAVAPTADATLLVAVEPKGDGQVPTSGRDQVRASSTGVSLDIDANGTIGALDRRNQYTPGYELTLGAPAPKISAGTTFNDAQYVGQKMNWVVEGLKADVTDVVFTILDVTQKPGFAENATNDKVTAAGATDDYSFDELKDSREKTVTVAPGAAKVTVPFWAKDYGGWAKLRVETIAGGKRTQIEEFTIPLDSDGDKIADAWERSQVSEWNRQFGKTEVFKPTFFGPDDDKELPDPDGPNTDGGTDMPAHKSEGDSLLVSEEYRGYVLDGGKGATDHGGGHARMSPVFKELLVEVDRMTGVTGAPDATGIKSIMNKVAAGFNDPTNGAGIRMYWLLDDLNAGPFVDQFVDAGQGGVTQADWTRAGNFNPTLPQRTDAAGHKIFAFVYLAFSSSHSLVQGGHNPYGGTGTTGSHVYVKRVAQYVLDHPNLNLSLNDGLATVAAHELTHIMLNGVGAEDLTNPNGIGQIGDADDQTYLMYESLSNANWGLFKFDALTRSHLGLTDKEFTRG